MPTRRTVLLASPPATGRRLFVPELELPPSLNHVYRDRANGRGRALTTTAKRYKAATALAIANAAQLQGVVVEPRRWLAVDITFAFAANNRDGDNACKLLMDAAAEALGFDDRYIQRLTWQKLVNPREPRCELTIEVL